jgi:hypothetical protein
MPNNGRKQEDVVQSLSRIVTGEIEKPHKKNLAAVALASSAG